MARFEMSWEWLGAFTEGDGCIHMRPNAQARPSQIFVTWFQSEKTIEVLEAIEEFLLAHDVQCRWYSREYFMANGVKLKQNSTMWTLRVSGRDSTEVALREIYPYLISKRAVAKRALKFLKFRPKPGRKAVV